MSKKDFITKYLPLAQKAGGKCLVVYLGKRNDVARDGSIQRKDSTTHTKRP